MAPRRIRVASLSCASRPACCPFEGGNLHAVFLWSFFLFCSLKMHFFQRGRSGGSEGGEHCRDFFFCCDCRTLPRCQSAPTPQTAERRGATLTPGGRTRYRRRGVLVLRSVATVEHRPLWKCTTGLFYTRKSPTNAPVMEEIMPRMWKSNNFHTSHQKMIYKLTLVPSSSRLN